MKLPAVARDLKRDLSEFDVWVTPSLGEISDAAKFEVELARIARVFDELGRATDNFQDPEHCQPAAIARTFAALAKGQEQGERAELFKALASTLYLVTGKSDNNSKCQFPLYLRNVAQWDKLPALYRRNGVTRIRQGSVPRTLKSDKFMDLVAAIDDESEESRLLEQFVSFQLMGKDAARQLWSVGHSYQALKNLGNGAEQGLLSPVVIFKVRGSVSASGGHHPEAVLRGQMEEWGLNPGQDFNLADVIVDRDNGVAGDGDVEDDDGEEKTRAYDFVLPYRTAGWYPEWEQRIMIQSQFYAGDSGSVSHKNVDQTAVSRRRVLQRYGSARFVECVDGAGYYSSLNGDLKKLLRMDTTRSFIQLRSAPIRLRRELQALGFLTPLEIEHAVARARGDEARVRAALVTDGYRVEEVDRALEACLARRIVERTEGRLVLRQDRREVARRYFLLDTLAIHGTAVEPRKPGVEEMIMVPGYGPHFGMPTSELAGRAAAEAGDLGPEILDPKIFGADVLALETKKYILVKR